MNLPWCLAFDSGGGIESFKRNNLEFSILCNIFVFNLYLNKITSEAQFGNIWNTLKQMEKQHNFGYHIERLSA